jgi:hypothetical protein
MARTLYQYNAKTNRYEVATENRRKKAWKRVLSFTLSLGLALTAFSFYIEYSYSLSEWWMKSRNSVLRKEYDFLFERTFYANRQLDQLIKNDDDNYRVILDSSPLPKTVRDAGIGGSEKLSLPQGENFPIILTNYQRLDKLKRQVEIEEQTMAEINMLLNEKVQMWASRPAIQPIDNRQLDQLYLTYGLRLHPIFKTLKDHKGLDFDAPRGTPVYATGDGKIEKAHFSGTYGNVVYINHDHGFETRYAHLSKFKVKVGDYVKRGQVIGLVGNTGNSVSAHLHYEVLIKGKHVNPINFFQRDLSNEEYEKLVRLGSENAQALD